MKNLLKAILADGQATVTIEDSTEMVQKAIETHALSPVAAAALGRTLTMTSMMGASLKNETDYLSVTIKGDGPLGSIVACGNADGCVKGYVDNPQAMTESVNHKLNVGAAVGKNGKITVIKDLGFAEPYIGTGRLVSGEIAEDFANYYAVSEQQPCLVALGVLENPDGSCASAAGVFVQVLPFAEEETLQALEAIAAKLGNVSGIMQNDTPRGVLQRYFGELKPEITEEKETAFRCDCCRERIDRVLLSLGEKDVAEILAQQGKLEIVCHFCNKKYEYTQEEAERLLASAKCGGEKS